MKLIDKLVRTLNKKDRMSINWVMDCMGISFNYGETSFDLVIDKLAHSATLSAELLTSDQIDEEDLAESDVISVINELSKHSEGVVYFFDYDARNICGNITFNFTSYDELVYNLENAIHTFFIEMEVVLLVAAGSRVDAHLDSRFIESKKEEAIY